MIWIFIIDVNLILVLVFLFRFFPFYYMNHWGRNYQTGLKYFYYQEGTKGLLHLLPPSSTFSWYLIHRETSLHWSSTSTNLQGKFLPINGGWHRFLVLPGVHLNEHREAWTLGLLGFLGFLHQQQSGSVWVKWPTRTSVHCDWVLSLFISQVTEASSLLPPHHSNSHSHAVSQPHFLST